MRSVCMCVYYGVSVRDRMQSVWTRACLTESSGVQEEGKNNKYKGTHEYATFCHHSVWGVICEGLKKTRIWVVCFSSQISRHFHIRHVQTNITRCPLSFCCAGHNLPIMCHHRNQKQERGTVMPQHYMSKWTVFTECLWVRIKVQKTDHSHIWACDTQRVCVEAKFFHHIFVYAFLLSSLSTFLVCVGFFRYVYLLLMLTTVWPFLVPPAVLTLVCVDSKHSCRS